MTAATMPLEGDRVVLGGDNRVLRVDSVIEEDGEPIGVNLYESRRKERGPVGFVLIDDLTYDPVPAFHRGRAVKMGPARP